MTLQFVIITVSDRSSKGERPDSSGPLLAESIRKRGWNTYAAEIIPDELEIIKNDLVKWSECGLIDIILTTGGTGFSPRDVTPEATNAIIQRPTPGLVEAMRIESLKLTPHAMLSRASAGIRAGTLIINLPGSPKAAVENFQFISPVLVHAVDLMRNAPGAETGHQFTS
jgi:molybdopterin adenylyltransferase